MDKKKVYGETNLVVEWKVSKDISEKKRLWKLWKVCGSRHKYLMRTENQDLINEKCIWSDDGSLFWLCIFIM